MRTDHELRHNRLLLPLLVSLALAGCGQKGPLFLSVPPAKTAPAAARPAATAAAPTAATRPARPPAHSRP